MVALYILENTKSTAVVDKPFNYLERFGDNKNVECVQLEVVTNDEVDLKSEPIKVRIHNVTGIT
jgi:hypothetical protein